MKLFNSILYSLVLTVTLFSCAPIYKCGEPKPAKKLFLPKAILNVINERDSLCSTLSARNNEIYNLKKDTTNLNKDIMNLEKRYSDLTNDKLSQSEQFNAALKKKTDELKQKSDELIAKEKLLSDRESALNDMRKIIARQDSITGRLNKILRDALLGFKSDELSVEIKNGKVYVSMSDKLLFKSGSAAIEAKGIDAIKVLADVLNKNNDIDILVEGHTDNIPIKTAQYHDNWDLSAARAISIVRILTDDYKIQPTRLTASGKGEFTPRASNATPEGRARNRRTEIILSPKLDELMKLLKTN
ncbi:MAG: OmpA family protein [Bacteroidota bacterium]|nr:OmpA family protein [Bacteroidota bacterium]